MRSSCSDRSCRRDFQGFGCTDELPAASKRPHDCLSYCTPDAYLRSLTASTRLTPTPPPPCPFSLLPDAPPITSRMISSAFPLRCYILQELVALLYTLSTTTAVPTPALFQLILLPTLRGLLVRRRSLVIASFTPITCDPSDVGHMR